MDGSGGGVEEVEGCAEWVIRWKGMMHEKVEENNDEWKESEDTKEGEGEGGRR